MRDLADIYAARATELACHAMDSKHHPDPYYENLAGAAMYALLSITHSLLAKGE